MVPPLTRKDYTFTKHEASALGAGIADRTTGPSILISMILLSTSGSAELIPHINSCIPL